MIIMSSQLPALGMTYDEIPPRNSITVAHWIDFSDDSQSPLDSRDRYYSEACWDWYAHTVDPTVESA